MRASKGARGAVVPDAGGVMTKAKGTKAAKAGQSSEEQIRALESIRFMVVMARIAKGWQIQAIQRYRQTGNEFSWATAEQYRLERRACMSCARHVAWNFLGRELLRAYSRNRNRNAAELKEAA